MLGEQIHESRGQSTGRRIIDTPDGPRMEQSVESQGTLLGVPGMTIGTFVAHPRPDGTMRCEGRGVFHGKGGASATFHANAIGLPQPDGAIRFRGSLCYATSSEALARLQRALVVFEEDVAPDGTSVKKAWEWV